MDYRVVLDESVVRAFQVPHCLLREPLGVDSRCLARGCGRVVSERGGVRGCAVVLGH